MENKKAKTYKRYKNFKIFFLIITAAVLSGVIYLKRNYHLTSFDQTFLTLQTGTTGTGLAVIKDIVAKNILVFPSILFLLLYPSILFYSFKMKKEKYEKEQKFKKEIEENNEEIVKLINFEKKSFLISLLVFFISLILLSSTLKINNSFFSILKGETTKIYDDYYVDGKKINMSFKDNKKKNLILIVAESMETSTFSIQNGGKYERSVTPELEQMAKDNISFSWTENLGGFKMAPGATLTTGALATFNTGVSPILDFSKFLSKENQEKYMPGAYSIGEFLKENGYNNQFILGSDANYGQRRLFYNSHGVDNIMDLYKAREIGYLPENYFDDWWGYEDEHLFRIAKSEISKTAKEGKPFFTTLLTVDTHFPNGQLPEGYVREYDKQYLDVYRNASYMINDFLNWLKKQSCYEDTVVVIVGDHLTMQSGFFGEGERYVYNAIINSDKEKDLKKLRNRKFITTDITPTILSAIGVEIEGDRFGMGTNLFSDKKTLVEEMGFEEYSTEAQKISAFYTKNISEDVEHTNIKEKINDIKEITRKEIEE